MIRAALSAVCLIALGATAQADDFVLGIGYDDVLDQTGTQAFALTLEYYGDPFVEAGTFRLRPGVAAQLDTDGDVWVGLGVGSTIDFGHRWFAETSLMAGYYNMGDGGTDLGHSLEFRSLFGIGHRFDGGRAIGLSIDHKSNAGLGDRNPGSETLLLRYRLEF